MIFTLQVEKEIFSLYLHNRYAKARRLTFDPVKEFPLLIKSEKSLNFSDYKAKMASTSVFDKLETL